MPHIHKCGTKMILVGINLLCPKCDKIRIKLQETKELRRKHESNKLKRMY